jgi:hypothetical protein
LFTLPIDEMTNAHAKGIVDGRHGSVEPLLRDRLAADVSADRRYLWGRQYSTIRHPNEFQGARRRRIEDVHPGEWCQKADDQNWIVKRTAATKARAGW